MESYAKSTHKPKKIGRSLKVEPHKHSFDGKKHLRTPGTSDEHSYNALQSNPIQPYRSGFSPLTIHSPVLP